MGRARFTILLVVVVAVTAAHYLTPTREHGLHALYRWFYHLPIILGSFWFGLRGGAGLALFITVLYLPHVFVQWDGGGAVHWLEIALYHVVGWVTGTLAEQQNRAYEDLKERTRQLLETEEQLRRADRLSVLGELSAGLAHEIRTPLASLRGAAEILAGSADDSEREEFSEILVNEADRLNRVLTDFLDCARPRPSGDGGADLGAVAEEVVRLVRLHADRTGVNLEVDVPDGLPAVGLDAELLKQVLLNLAMNAVQASDRGGRVRVGAAAVTGAVVLSVEDEGRGIPEENRERVFDPFFTTREGGTGLGLPVVRKILAASGAAIEIVPARDRGTIVRATLPEAEGGDGNG